jgi:hypothetical protein
MKFTLLDSFDQLVDATALEAPMFVYTAVDQSEHPG